MHQIALPTQGVLIHQAGAMRHETCLARRFVAKLLVDVVPAALASLAVGCLLTQYQFGHKTLPPAATAQASPASAEMVQLVRDEHAAILDYLKAQTAAEQKRYAAEDDADAQAIAVAAQAADAKAGSAAAASTRQATAAAAAALVASRQPAMLHGKAPAPVVVAAAAPAVQAPQAVAPAPQIAAAEPVAVVLPKSHSLFDRTLDIKDHVVHATLHAVSAIGGIPNWIASWGSGSGISTQSATDAPQFGASS